VLHVLLFLFFTNVSLLLMLILELTVENKALYYAACNGKVFQWILGKLIAECGIVWGWFGSPWTVTPKKRKLR